MNTMHLFAGVGGGLLADLILGHKPIIAVEWDKYACKILRERAADGWFPDLSVWEGDVRLFDPSEYAGQVDCIHAGFPCQDISVAGKQAGLGEGTRSGLYREILRIAGIVRPRYLFLENVSAILTMGGIVVIADLAKMGYVGRALCIRASDVGAPHGRDRWFALAELANRRGEGIHQRGGLESVGEEVRHIRGNEFDGVQGSAQEESANVGNPKHNGQPASEVSQSITTGNGSNATWTQPASEPTRPSEQYAELADTDLQHGIRRSEPQQSAGDSREAWNQSGWGSEDVGDSESARQQGSINRQGEVEPWGASTRDQQYRGWWEVESNVGRVAYGVPNRVHRLKGLGNAQVPLQAAMAWRLLFGKGEYGQN